MELLNRRTTEEDSAEAFLKLQDQVKMETVNWGNVAKPKTEGDEPIKQEREALECCGIVFNNEDDAVNHYYDLQHGNVSKSVRKKRKKKLKTGRAKRSKNNDESVEACDDENEEKCVEKKRRNRSSRAVFLNSIKDISVEKSEKSIITQIVRDPGNGNKPMYVCAICKAIIPTRKAFSQHSRDEHNGMIAQCDLCHYQADNMQRMAGHRLSRHEKVTEGYGIIHCDRPGCGFRCVVNSELAFHVSSAHEKNLPPRICETCGKVFQTSGGLKMHKDIKHLGIRKYPCDQCDKRFTTDSHLRYHKAREHEKHLPSPFEVVCDECGKCYPRRNSLLQHIRSAHRQEKNNVCSYCGKAFFGSSQLRNHVKGVHQLDKTFVCPHCDRGMPNAYQLQIHINCHLKKKLYHCRLCDSWYTAGYTLAFHIAVRHLGFSQADGKKKENIDRARGHEAYEKVKDDENTSMASLPQRKSQETKLNDDYAKRKFDLITEMKDNGGHNTNSDECGYNHTSL